MSRRRRVALTTFDNPFSPFSQFNEWFVYDVTRGYNSCGYLARIARTSSQLTDEENDAEVERAIDEIIKYDPLNIYTKAVDNGETDEATPNNSATKVNDLKTDKEESRPVA